MCCNKNIPAHTPAHNTKCVSRNISKHSGAYPGALDVYFCNPYAPGFGPWPYIYIYICVCVCVCVCETAGISTYLLTDAMTASLSFLPTDLLTATNARDIKKAPIESPRSASGLGRYATYKEIGK